MRKRGLKEKYGRKVVVEKSLLSLEIVDGLGRAEQAEE